jgi:hypothetical protein
MADHFRERRARRVTAFALPIAIAAIMFFGAALAPTGGTHPAASIAAAQGQEQEPGVQVEATTTGEVADITPGPSGPGGADAAGGSGGGSGGGSDLTGNPGASGGVGNSSTIDQGNPGDQANRTDNPQSFPWWALLIPLVLAVGLALFFMRPRGMTPADVRANAADNESDPSANSGTGDTGTMR